MASPFLAGSSSSSASSPLSYMIPRPPAPSSSSLAQGQGFLSCGVLLAQQGRTGVNVGGSGEAVGVGAARQGGTGRHAGAGHPPPRECPRCRSGNTKFCYYNNHSRKQPRYLCRACRRHWTEGGTLRDVPVGGGRKNRRNGGGSRKATVAAAKASPSTTDAASAGVDALIPTDILRQMLFFPPGFAAGGGAGAGVYGIDLGARQQQTSAAAPAPMAPQGRASDGDVGAVVGGTAVDGANCGDGVQYWSGGWQMQGDMPGFDGTF